MGEADWDAAKSSSQQTYSETHLTPRLMSGDVDREVGRGRVLPLSTNARSGWDSKVHGQGSASLTGYMNVDKRLRKSLLRDMNGNFTVDVSDSSSGKLAYHVQTESEVAQCLSLPAVIPSTSTYHFFIYHDNVTILTLTPSHPSPITHHPPPITHHRPLGGPVRRHGGRPQTQRDDGETGVSRGESAQAH